MHRVNDEHSSMAPKILRRLDSAALGMILTLPVAVTLWLAIILTVFEIFKWASPA